MPIIYSTHPLHPRAAKMLAGAGELRIASALDAATLKQESRDAAAVIVRAVLPPDMFAGDHVIRAAIRHGAGLDMIPVEEATAAGVLVANLPGANARSVAEHAIFAALALLRGFRRIDGDLRRHGWFAGREHANSARELAGRTLGIVGMGAIGREVAAIGHHGFGLEVLGASRSGKGFPDHARAVPLDVLVAESDIIVLACPLTPDTVGLMSRQRILAMKPGALLVNVSRGPVIDDEALLEALREGGIGGAALDVFTRQPLAPDHPYLGLDNVIVTPHLAGITEESMMRMGVGAVEEALRVLAGELPLNLRNPEAVARYRQRFPQ
ncbi:NAD(P)-dependent oxidoreductase [Mesorhizobium sp. LHD-90]|uniref:NAD(P)-dependent oxidoreductase n=1 Tax=Mesorhizobium sp. LHD-90 TaxID=3071414 RepID=UPI0027E0E680|nr:NAD(P)-dependent oxidoreductase [Mesorhizobium sp. LHD-90]MDQ6436206.1 NAD(P)-dependent oxidoreductase [Mesorhizobium sp. LHD-90]